MHRQRRRVITTMRRVWSYRNNLRARRRRACRTAPNFHRSASRFIDVVCHAINFIVRDLSNCLFGSGHTLHPLTVHSAGSVDGRTIEPVRRLIHSA